MAAIPDQVLYIVQKGLVGAQLHALQRLPHLRRDLQQSSMSDMGGVLQRYRDTGLCNDQENGSRAEHELRWMGFCRFWLREDELL